MSYENAENSCGFGGDHLNSGYNSNFGAETSERTSGFGVENPSFETKSNCEGVAGSSMGVASVREMLNINSGNTQGIAGGQTFSGNINDSYGDDYIDGLCDTFEMDDDQSWIDSESIFGSAVKAVSDFCNRYFASESKSIENVVGNVDNTIVSAIEELTSGSWDSCYRNIQLDGCNGGEIAASDEKDAPATGNGIQLDYFGGSVLSGNSSGADHSVSE